MNTISANVLEDAYSLMRYVSEKLGEDCSVSMYAHPVNGLMVMVEWKDDEKSYSYKYHLTEEEIYAMMFDSKTIIDKIIRETVKYRKAFGE